MRAKSVSRMLLYLGVLLVVGGLGEIHASQHDYDFAGSSRFAWAGTYAALLIVAAYGYGLPDVVRRGWASAGRSAAALITGALGVSVVQLFVGDALLPRFVVFGSALCLLPWYVGCASLAGRGRMWAEGRDRLLVVADDEDVRLLSADVDLEPERPVTLAAALSPEQAARSGKDRSPLAETAASARATVVVLSRRAQDDDTIVHQAAELHERGVRVRTLSLFYEQWLGKLPVPELERVSLFFDISEIHRVQYSRASRLLDLGLALVGTIVLIPIMGLVLVANAFGNRGPLFYRQARVGKQGVVFQILKFRTMKPDADRLHNEWTSEDDPRITPFGRVLRRSHMDELPQVINILRGELSVVGPRPEQPAYVAELVAKLPFYELRHLVRPGLTGWAQVKYGYAGSEADALEKLQYEFYYLRHQSLRLDLRIIARTSRSVLGRRGR